jgi:uncharacterized 2Fe-2S/4Fe-4S cluster protein (DUF4445 family)
MTASQPKHRAILMPSGRQGDVAHGTTVLEAARQLGVEISPSVAETKLAENV